MTRDVIHILSGLERGGIESWLMNIWRNSATIRDRSVICLIADQRYSYSGYHKEIMGMGLPIYHVPFSFIGVPFVVNLRKFFREINPTIVHSHMNYLSGYATLAAQLEKVPIRIAHYHVSYPEQHKTLLKRCYINIIQLIEQKSATNVLGCSSWAIESYYGCRWQKNKKRQVLYYGIEFNPFKAAVDRELIRTDLGIDDNAFVIGHVGRFSQQKNHDFLIDIALELVREKQNFKLLLIGDGPSRSVIERRVAQVGLTESVIFAGVRADVSRLMLAAMDLFLFPSLFEGLGLVLIEAQAAGLPCIFSDVVPAEADVVKPLVTRLSLSQSAASWVEAILAVRDRGQVVTRTEALAIVEQSPFNILSGVKKMEQVYGLDNGRLFTSSGNQDG